MAPKTKAVRKGATTRSVDTEITALNRVTRHAEAIRKERTRLKPGAETRVLDYIQSRTGILVTRSPTPIT